MKFGTSDKSNMLMMNTVLGIGDFKPKILDSGKVGPNTQIFSDFDKIWHSQQIGHANYEYNTRQCL